MLRFTPTRIEADATGAKRHDLQEPAGHRHVLEEVKELVLIAEIAVEGEGRRDAEDGRTAMRHGRGKLAASDAVRHPGAPDLRWS
jgi:hypothetical protein